MIAINYNYSISPLEKWRLCGGGNGLLHRVPGLVGGVWKLYWQHTPIAVASAEASSPLSMVLGGSLTHSSEESCYSEDKSHHPERGNTVQQCDCREQTYPGSYAKPCPAGYSLIQNTWFQSKPAFTVGERLKSRVLGVPFFLLQSFTLWNVYSHGASSINAYFTSLRKQKINRKANGLFCLYF